MAEILDVTEAEYHADYSSISKTMLATFCKSPVEYHETFVTKRLDRKGSSAKMDFGKVCHAVLLEGRDLTDVVAEIPIECLKSNGHRNTTGQAWKDFERENSGKVLLKNGEKRQYQQAIDAVYRHVLADIISKSTCEKAVYWTDRATGLECRCKPDFMLEVNDVAVCYDLKFSPEISDEAFRRQAKRFSYWLQDAHYSEGIADLTGRPVTFRFWIVEPQYPFRIVPKWFCNRTREMSFERRDKKMRELLECMTSGNWTDRWIGEITLAEWDYQDGDDGEETYEGDSDEV